MATRVIKTHPNIPYVVAGCCKTFLCKNKLCETPAIFKGHKLYMYRQFPHYFYFYYWRVCQCNNSAANCKYGMSLTTDGKPPEAPSADAFPSRDCWVSPSGVPFESPLAEWKIWPTVSGIQSCNACGYDQNSGYTYSNHSAAYNCCLYEF